MYYAEFPILRIDNSGQSCKDYALTPAEFTDYQIFPEISLAFFAFFMNNPG